VQLCGPAASSPIPANNGQPAKSLAGHVFQRPAASANPGNNTNGIHAASTLLASLLHRGVGSTPSLLLGMTLATSGR
jgi:hypothetical protein